MQTQLLDIAIGLVAAFVLLSLLASAAVEIGSNLLKKRSQDLAVVLDQLIGRESIDLRDTSVWKAMEAASRRKRGPSDERGPSYLSARSFADAVVEGLIKLKSGTETVGDVVARLPTSQLKDRITALQAELGDDLVAIKAGLEGWFDDTMDRLEGAYKRWSQWLLLLFGLLFAAVLNVSAVRIVDSLWTDSVLRASVVDSAQLITEEPCPPDQPSCSPEEKIEHAINGLEGLKVPVGWSDGWSDESGAGWTILGILPTGLAVVMGAPFWFDLLKRLAGVRGGKGVPPKAVDDIGSATVELAQAPADRSVLRLMAR